MAAPAPVPAGLPTSPRSPTLSCADMILPESSLRSFSPSPYMERPPSPPGMLYHPASRPAPTVTLAAAPQGHRGPAQKMQSPPLSAHSSRSTLRTMATSDGSAQPRGGARHGDDALASSPTIAESLASRAPGAWTHQRSPSDASSSVHSDDLENMTWPTFDGPGPFNDDSGVVLEEDEDDEGDDRFPNSTSGEDEENDRWLKSHSEADDDAFSSAALSRRAEIILANAKKRLNVMEGNLRGARQSLVVSPTVSDGTLGEALSHQLAAARDRDRRLYAGHGPIPPRIRYYASPLSSNSSPSHARGMSETAVPIPFMSSYTASRTANKRASSAMGLGTGPWSPGNFGQGRFPLRESRSFEVVGNPRIDTNGHEEREPSLPSQESRGSRSPSNTLETLPEDEDDPESLRPISGTIDLRSQMQDLKGRISSLKARATEDNYRRRSLQSLRIPSPFTCAETFYSDGVAYKTGGSPVIADAGVCTKAESPVRKTLYGDEGSDESIPKGTPLAQAALPKEDDGALQEHEQQVQSPTDYQDAHDFRFTDDLPEYDDDDEGSEDIDDIDDIDFVSVDGTDFDAGGESVYEDAVYEMPVAERHEDRLDAFDYEHFFLHSAMGTYSNSTSRRSSSSSADSVATTRPATAVISDESTTSTTPPKRIWMHQRNSSVDSVSTIASFATAAEEQSDDEEEENEQMDQFSEQLLSSQQLHLANQNGHSSLRSDSAINMRPALRRANSSDTPALQQPSSRGPSPGGDLSNGLQTSKIYSILLGSPTPMQPRLALNEEEKQLIYSLAASFQQVCASLRSTAGDQYERKEWRRRLDEARRVLNGEGSEEEAF